MTDSEILEKYQQPFPVSFKIIGVGTGPTDIIVKFKLFGYDCVGCIPAETPGDCILWMTIRWQLSWRGILRKSPMQ